MNPPISRRAAWAIFLGLTIIVAVADQLSKAWVVASYSLATPAEVLGEFVRITLVHNTGALFGLFHGQAVVFGIASLAVIGLIIWYQARTAGSGLLPAVALGLLLGGAIGNLSDRLRMEYVVDFVDMGIGEWRFYTFNVADAAISISILLLIVMAIGPNPRQSPARS